MDKIERVLERKKVERLPSTRLVQEAVKERAGILHKSFNCVK